MADKIEGRAREILEDKNFVVVAVPDGSGDIWTAPVWVHTDGETVNVNSAEGRKWPRLVRENGGARLLVQNLQNPYEYVSIKGRLVEDTHEGAYEDIDSLAKKYLDQDTYPAHKEGEQRVILKFAPDKLTHNGG